MKQPGIPHIDDTTITVTFSARSRKENKPIKDIKQAILDAAKGPLQQLKVTEIDQDYQFVHFRTNNKAVIEALYTDLLEDYILDGYTEEQGPGKGIRAM